MRAQSTLKLVAAVEVQAALAAQAYHVAKQIQARDVDAATINGEGGVSFLEKGSVWQAEAQKLEQIDQDWQVADLATGQFDRAEAAEAVHCDALSIHVTARLHAASDVRARLEINPAELRQIDGRASQVDFKEKRRAELEAR
jgi:hypothetical protein